MALKEIITKITAETTKQVLNLARFGLSFFQMEKMLALTEGCLEKYAKRSPAFTREIEIAELRVLVEVEQAFLKRALGYETTEVQRIYIPAEEGADEENVVFKEIRYVKKIVPPDLASIQLWLTNRNSARWNKNPVTTENKESYEDYLKKNLKAHEEIRANS